LSACIRRGFRFVDSRCNTVNVEDARKCQPAESGTDDRDWSIHPNFFVVGGIHKNRLLAALWNSVP